MDGEEAFQEKAVIMDVAKGMRTEDEYIHDSLL
jgi:hypothetical protein